MFSISKGISLLLSLMLTSQVMAATSAPAFIVLDEFGDNPGELSASYFKPSISPRALVVLLHGCLQNGEQLATNTGLIGLANKYQFSVLMPQQSQSNNMTACFNWFSPQDANKDQGEMLSIKNMIATIRQQQQIEDVYIAGLSAGGAMTSAMLINYPQLFKAGAIIAGVPFPCADELIKAISCMKNGPSSEDELINQAHAMISTPSNLPRLSIWTGSSDTVVNPKNAQAMANQWLVLAEINAAPQVTQTQTLTRSTWQNTTGTNVIELNTIAQIGHGITVNPEQEHGGQVGNYLLQAPVATMPEVIAFFGLKTNINQ